jgi:hypothetical protein
VLSVPLIYSDYVLRLHAGFQWVYTKTAKMDANGILRWGQEVKLRATSGTLVVQLIGSGDANLQVVALDLMV